MSAAMSAENITLHYVETAEDAAARLARSTGNARVDLNNHIEDLKTAIGSIGDNIHESLSHGRVTHTGMRREEYGDGSASFEFRFTVEFDALPLNYDPKSIFIMDREGGRTCVLRLTATHLKRYQ